MYIGWTVVVIFFALVFRIFLKEYLLKLRQAKFLEKIPKPPDPQSIQQRQTDIATEILACLTTSCVSMRGRGSVTVHQYQDPHRFEIWCTEDSPRAIQGFSILEKEILRVIVYLAILGKDSIQLKQGDKPFEPVGDRSASQLCVELDLLVYQQFNPSKYSKIRVLIG